MKHQKCLKCGTFHNPSLHHIVPKYFGGHMVIPLCRDCHRKIEQIICAIEHHKSGFPYGQRFRLPDDEYEFIASNFCRKEIKCVVLL